MAGPGLARAGCDDGGMAKPPVTASFRRNTAIMMAAILAVFAGASLGSWAPALLPVLVVPALIGVWGWRSGTDAGPDGLTIRAALGSRRIPWSDVSDLVPEPNGRVSAHLVSGAVLELPAVAASDLPALVAASGSAIATPPDRPEARDKAETGAEADGEAEAEPQAEGTRAQ